MSTHHLFQQADKFYDSIFYYTSDSLSDLSSSFSLNERNIYCNIKVLSYIQDSEIYKSIFVEHFRINFFEQNFFLSLSDLF